MLPVEVRFASAADVQAYGDLLTAIFAESLPTLVPRAAEHTQQQLAAFIRTHDGTDSALFVAESGGALVGSLNLTRLNRPQIDHVVLLGLNVANAARRRGVGKALLSHGLQWARRNRFAERVELEVLENNVPAIRLYQQFGFIHEGTKVRAVKRGSEYLSSEIYATILAFPLS